MSGLLMPRRPSATSWSACNLAIAPARPLSPSELVVAKTSPSRTSPSERLATMLEMNAWPSVLPSRPVS